MIKIAFILFLLFADVFSQKTADFIILAQPRDYTIFNQYEQPITEPEKKLFMPYSPLQIENANEVLGDQITRALRVTFGGETWFFQEDDGGNLPGGKGAQNRALYKKCPVLNDTVQIVNDRTVCFWETFPPSGRAGFLEKGERVERVFAYGGYCCVKRIGARVHYGWSSFAQKTGWRRVERVAEKRQTGLSNFLSERIVQRFTAANRAYKEYFDHFNTLTQQEKSVPSWRCEIRGNEVYCSLNAPYNATSELDESTHCLVRDIENMLIGKHYVVVPGKGDITIRPGSEGGGQ